MKTVYIRRRFFFSSIGPSIMKLYAASVNPKSHPLLLQEMSSPHPLASKRPSILRIK